MPVPEFFGRDKVKLTTLGYDRVTEFCLLNKIFLPAISIWGKEKWRVSACAYYRNNEIYICPQECQFPATAEQSRVWSWPGSTVDRTPYGVVAHELGHHVDVEESRARGWKVGDYYGDFASWAADESSEQPLTNYCPNVGEWFAEHFRLFITNPDLLYRVRPKTFALFCSIWQPLQPLSYVQCLGSNCPPRIVKAQENKMVKGAEKWPVSNGKEKK